MLDGPERAPSRGMLYAVGFKKEDFQKTIVGVASTWSMVTPCNVHIDKLARESAKGVDEAGGKSIIFNTITVSDGISMGNEGMKYSLVSREVIADSIETVAGCGGFDGLVAIGGCDKNMPGCLIAFARLNRPAVFVYGGTILPGCIDNRNIDIVSIFEAVGAHSNGKISDGELEQVESCAIPGPGSCGGMYTANTMASAIEALGMSLPNSSAQAAISKEKLADAALAGAAVVELIKRGIRPSDIMTKEAFENAMTVAIALGGSTNAVLHLLAMANAAGIKLKLDDWTRIGKRVPVLADLKPSGKHVMWELVQIGGIMPLMKMLLGNGLLHGDCMTVSGKTLKENLEKVEDYPSGADNHPRIQGSDQAQQPSCRALWESGPGRRRCQIFRQRRATLRGEGASIRVRRKGAPRDPGRQDPERRRDRDSLRRSKRGTWNARDAGSDLCNHGQRTRERRRADYRWKILRRQPRICYRTCDTGSVCWRTDRDHQEW